MKKPLIILPLLLLLLLPSCAGKQAAEDAFDPSTACADTLTLHSSLLTIADAASGEDGDTVTFVDIRSPWAEGQYLARLALVPDSAEVPGALPEGITVLRTPLSRTAVFSSVHTSAMAELGALASLAAVADGSYFNPADTVAALLREGHIKDVGQSMSPSVEKLIAAECQAVLLSPMQGEAMPQLAPGVAAIPMADYLETSPIGRAEWILLLGKLFGQADRAEEIFDRVVNDYCDLTLKAETDGGNAKPLVLTELPQGGTWYVPAGRSYMARMIADAGGRWPWADSEGTGSLQLSPEQVLAGAHKADIWLVRTYGSTPTLASVKASAPLAPHFKAWTEGRVYGCNTAEVPVFDDTAFHPERVLADLVAIFHPAALPDHKLRYYSRAE